jgi:hypothetical protein
MTWVLRFCVAAAFVVLLAGQHHACAQQAQSSDWRSDWELADGLNMTIDTQGYQFPVQVVFVPNPGIGPKDPLYFVVEIKGNIKVVTNDRTVETFAANFLPIPQGQSFIPAGAAAMCLDPKNGYVFATFAFVDNTLNYRNGMVRFTSKPGQFGLKAEKADFFMSLFKDEVSATSHQIGPCAVKDDQIYVAVGYGNDRSVSQNLHTTLGKILRMTVDFASLPDNPFYKDDGKATAEDYIWAYGFRNVFGLHFVRGRLFATENGGGVDRFNEIVKGDNYLWEGTDWSMGSRAAQLFSPSIGIVHLDYVPPDSRVFPDAYRGRFVAPTSGIPNAVGPSTRGSRSVLMWDYDFSNSRMASPPRPIVQYRGRGMQLPVSAALGPDGLYFISLLPNSAGSTPVYKITYDPAANYPHRLGADQTPQALINEFQCRQCHRVGSSGGGTAGPPLEASLIPKLTERLNSPAYEAQVAELDKLETQPFASYREARREVLAAKGEERVRRWLPIYLREPKFDNPNVGMPAVGLNETQAGILARYLRESTTARVQELGWFNRMRFAASRGIPDLRYRHLVFSFVLGIVVAFVSIYGFRAWSRRRAR